MPFQFRSSLGFALGRTNHVLRAAIVGKLREMECPCSPEEFQGMILLADVDKPLNMGEFAELMVRDPTTLKRQLDTLAERSFITRIPSPEDARVVLVSLTSIGRKELQRVLPALDALRQRVMEGISPSDAETTVRCLQQMQQNLMAE